MGTMGSTVLIWEGTLAAAPAGGCSEGPRDHQEASTTRPVRPCRATRKALPTPRLHMFGLALLTGLPLPLRMGMGHVRGSAGQDGQKLPQLSAGRLQLLSSLMTPRKSSFEPLGREGKRVVCSPALSNASFPPAVGRPSLPLWADYWLNARLTRTTPRLPSLVPHLDGSTIVIPDDLSVRLPLLVVNYNIPLRAPTPTPASF
ncbi:hypothetical protein B0T11DRAFT_70305 [Plectosphaerella cucumerina]|uniref:Uncharacterized protein n=1 Tax=Plectosphaerella cucumerina TaxID=40658 RepID=A0A8K0X6P0_9PEZI|nr:hypothetical protein B0T11DRAFT_70305 [Plectosphaerella cucumerina]